MTAHSVSIGRGSPNRVWQLVAAIVAMMAIANLQYAWTLFVGPIGREWGWSKAAIQVAFSMFIIAETWLVPFEAWLADRYGARPLVLFGGALVGASWIINSFASSLGMLYFGMIVGGIGAGAVYGTCVGMAAKWFPDRRGLAAGLVAGGYGAGTALTVLPIQMMIEGSGYKSAFLVWGFIQGAICIICAFVMRFPPNGWAPAGWNPLAAAASGRGPRQSAHDYHWTEAIRTGRFWLLYVMFTMIAATGLMATAQIAPIAKDFGVSKVLILGVEALVLAVVLDRVLNGVTRPFWGWVSDHIGRENTMGIAFTFQAVAIILLLLLAHQPVWFVILSGLVFFGWGEIFSLFPATIGDLFGSKYATTNYGILYTAKGVASIFAGPLASLVAATSSGWTPVFVSASIASILVAAMALFILKPIVKKTIGYAPHGEPAGAGTATAPAD